MGSWSMSCSIDGIYQQQFNLSVVNLRRTGWVIRLAAQSDFVF
jgi:hypothetical protein